MKVQAINAYTPSINNLQNNDVSFGNLKTALASNKARNVYKVGSGLVAGGAASALYLTKIAASHGAAGAAKTAPAAATAVAAKGFGDGVPFFEPLFNGAVKVVANVGKGVFYGGKALVEAPYSLLKAGVGIF